MMTKENNVPPRPRRQAGGRKINRVGSRTPEIGTVVPNTLGQRMTARRIELDLTQDQVASQVRYRPKSGRGKGVEKSLSRATLAMYERDASQPDLQKIEEIAKALKVAPGHLAFGEG